MSKMVEGRPNQFINGIPRASWLKWFKKINLQYTFRIAQYLEVNRALFENLATRYSKHTYSLDQIWNVDEMHLFIHHYILMVYNFKDSEFLKIIKCT